MSDYFKKLKLESCKVEVMFGKIMAVESLQI